MKEEEKIRDDPNGADYIEKEPRSGQRRRGSPVYEEERHERHGRRHSRRYYDNDEEDEDRYRRRRRSRSPRYRRRSSRERYSRYRSWSPRNPDDDRHKKGSRKRHAREKMAAVEDPFAALRSAAGPPSNPAEMARKMQEQQLQARQLVLQQQAVSAVKAANRTQREVYIGNITIGAVNEKMIHDLFKATLTAAFPAKCQNEMATACLDLSGKVQLMGSVLTLGRPAGYVDPKQASTAALTAANALATFQADGEKEEVESGRVTQDELKQRPSAFLCIDGVVDDSLPEEEYAEIVEDLKSELERHGTVLRLFIAEAGSYQGKALVHFLDAESASKAREVIDGRLFDGRRLCATCMRAQEYVQVAV